MPSEGRTPLPAVVALGGAILGTGLMVWGFLAGLDAGFSGLDVTPYLVLFFAGTAVVLAALVISIILLVRGGSIAIRVIAAFAIVIALLPIAAVVRLWLGA